MDAQGHFVPHDDRQLEFEVVGAGRLIATDNGYQADTSAFGNSIRKTWKGKALGIVRATGKKGKITLTVKGEGLKKEVLELWIVDRPEFQQKKI